MPYILVLVSFVHIPTKFGILLNILSKVIKPILLKFFLLIYCKLIQFEDIFSVYFKFEVSKLDKSREVNNKHS